MKEIYDLAEQYHNDGNNCVESVVKACNDGLKLGLPDVAIRMVSGMGGGIGIGIATGKATEAISRQPEASGKIQTNLLLGAALAEGTAIFGFVVALLIILFLGQ